MKIGDVFCCDDCGLKVEVKEICTCDECDIVCCQKPMTRKEGESPKEEDNPGSAPGQCCCGL
jgi:hypothetical protein